MSGETLLVLGASGGTGTAAVQLGKVFGARVIAVASTEAKRTHALAQGADMVLAPSEALKDQLKAAGGVDVIFDPVGGELAETCFRAIKPNGRYLTVGFASGHIPAIPFNLPLLKSASIVGVFWGAFWRNFPEENRRNVFLLLSLLAQEKLKVSITKTYALSEAAQALDDLISRKAMGKVMLEVR